MTGTLLIEITDDGVGGPTGKGTGLFGLRDRLDALGAVLTVHISQDGTPIRGSVPFDADSQGFRANQLAEFYNLHSWPENRGTTRPGPLDPATAQGNPGKVASRARAGGGESDGACGRTEQTPHVSVSTPIW
jgi:hypothetical protein